MNFVFDLDDTISATDAYSEEYIRDFFAEHNWPYSQIATDVRFAEAKFDWDNETALKWYKEYGDQMMAEFPCLPNVKEVMAKLRKDGHKVIIATARATDWHTDPAGVTIKWLEDAGIKYDNIYIGRIDKEKICEEENADVFVDDDIKIVSKVAEYFKGKSGKHVFLSTTRYNKNLEVPSGVTRIKDFKEMLDVLNSDSELL